ncbi:MAG: SpoVG family protein [Pirellula sp.]
MEITEVRIKLMEESEDRLRAFCSITIDHSFVIRDLKIIEGVNGPFVAMPSRKMTARCGKCGNKNYLRSHYCNQCGARLRGPQDIRDSEGASSNKLYADIAHPINQICRDMIQNSVIREYSMELERAKQPGYKSRYDDEYVETLPGTNADPSVPLGTTIESGAVPKPHYLEPKKADSVASESPSNPKQGKGFGDGIF